MTRPQLLTSIPHRTGFDVYAFSLMEYELGIIVACLPALRALLKLMSERARLRGSEGKLGNDQAVGWSPESETVTWLGESNVERCMSEEGCRNWMSRPKEGRGR